MVVLVALARWIAPRPSLLAPLAVLTLPFRIPIQAGGNTSNLLVPLYLVVAVASLAWIMTALRDRVPARSRTGRLRRLGGVG